jgi:hypothetical protein
MEKNMPIPTTRQNEYKSDLWGVFGEIGAAGGSVRFLQATLPINLVEQLTLVADLPGSERWPIRQLFQRDIDVNRVTEEILPYFKRTDRIKFFNPLTLALLPISETHEVQGELKEEIKAAAKDPNPTDQSTWKRYEAQGFYRLNCLPEDVWARLEWNPERIKLVAIDGQHRLSALQRLAKELQRDPSDQQLQALNLGEWKVPVIVIVAPSDIHGTARLSLLDKTRDIFVTINKQAKPPTRCRTILLNDYSITSMCCQELLDHCHAQKGATVPLLFFDWRASGEGEQPESPVAFMRVEELEDIHINYLLGGSDWDETLSQEQREALFIDDMTPPLNEVDKVEMRSQLRNRYRKTVMLGVLYVLENFTPFKIYVDSVKNLVSSAKNDIQKHALSRLEFGKHHGADNLEEKIRQAEQTMISSCQDAKTKMPNVFQQLIGLRGVFCGLEMFRQAHDEIEILQWEDLAKSYVEGLNKAFKSDLFADKLLKHIVWDHNNSVANYRLENSWEAFGAYCALSAIAKNPKLSSDTEAVSDPLKALFKTLKRGYRKEVRPGIQDANQSATKEEINKLVNAEAEKKAKSQIKRIEKAHGVSPQKIGGLAEEAE